MAQMFLALLMVCCLWQQSQGQCDLSGKATESKDFPDLFEESVLSYQLTVEFTTQKASQSDLFKEYYDILNKRGRVDMNVNGTSSSYYYYQETNEAFEVSGRNCESLVMNETNPKFMKEDPTEWTFTYPNQPMVRGPSAMFRYALMTWKNNRAKMAYLGEVSEKVRDISVQKWRRCVNDLSIDYYFTLDTRENVFEERSLVLVPLRVVVNRTNDKSGFYPQIYEILIMQPYISDQSKVLQVPSGKGCVRGDRVFKPEMKKYLDSTIFTMVEAVCLNCNGMKQAGLWNYYSTFTFASDQQSSQYVYIYSPWGEVDEKGKQLPGGLKHVLYDGKYGYLYTLDIVTDACEITRVPRFSPRYYFPKGGGYIDLTDEFILYPDQEYGFLDNGYYKGMPVFIYEAVIDGYNLGNRSIAKAIFTRYYFRDNVTDNENVVPGALTAIVMTFFPNKDSKTDAMQLTFNFYGFATRIPYRRYLFSVGSCFKGSDDSSWVTLTFPSDPLTLKKLQDEGPNIELEVFTSLLRNSELVPLRIPTMLLDISNAVYITLQILEKPPLALDFQGPEEGFIISETQRTEAISDFQSCAKICTETETFCWGISICGEMCYLGVDSKAKITQKNNCTLYRRYNNGTTVFSKEMMITSIKREVEEHRIGIVVPNLGEGGATIQLEATYIDVSSKSGKEDTTNKLGRKTDPRFNKYKPGSKLVKTGETIKNLGSLGYEQCQKECLDYKQCETLSYCSNGPQCILTSSNVEDLSKDNFVTDSLCTVLSRKYADHFINTPGTHLARSSQKPVKAASAEECARLCLKENSFTCLSFDFCPWDTAVTCLLHNVHFLDENSKEPMKTNVSCGHYYKKYSYDFTRKPQLRSVGSSLVSVSKPNLETCAKTCVELKNGTCLGYDFCQDKKLTATSCILFVDAAVAQNTTHSDICDHYTKIVKTESAGGSSGGTSVVWIGVLCFFVALAIGIALTFGIAYFRMRRSS